MGKFWYLNKIFLILFIVLSSPVLAMTEVSYQGQIDFTKNQFDLVFNMGKKGVLSLTAHEVANGNYAFFLDADHLKTPLFDISTQGKGILERKGEQMHGKVQSRYTLVDYQPIRELYGSFDIKGGRFYLSSLSVGNIACQGYVELDRPYKLNFMVDLADMGMQDFLNFWMRSKEKKIEAEGRVSGTIKVSGDLNRTLLKGNLVSFNGVISKLAYHSIRLHAEGIYPYLEIAQSTFSKADGFSFALEGPFDLSDTENFKKQVKSLTGAPIVSDSASSSEWTIRRFEGEEDGGAEIKYFLRKDKETNSSSHEAGGMLGVQRTVDF